MVTVWDLVKWPVLLLLVSFMFALLYWASPNAKADNHTTIVGNLVEDPSSASPTTASPSPTCA
jgi:uncharacterized BrkB/YihY/UPF0761 family membrane protein